MYKRIICCFFAGLFLISSVVFPLGDISLMRDIPQMYQNYTKITSAEEMGIIDFVGDYLLYGKQIFGHNAHDKIPAKGNDVQFQHQASPLNVVLLHRPINLLIAPVTVTEPPVQPHIIYNGDFRNKLFRPPLA